MTVLLRSLVLGVSVLSLVGCKADQLTNHGAEVVMLDNEPAGCEFLGVVIGRGGGLTGAYSKPSTVGESADNDARNKAAELGATHLWMHPDEVAQGDGHGPDYQDTTPPMAHGSGTGSTITVAASAYKCALDAQPPVTVASIQGPGAGIEIQTTPVISMAALGKLSSVSVYQRTPLTPEPGATETEVLRIEDPAVIQEVLDALKHVAVDPLRYIPTHRIEFVGELGMQSLLYGFGYLKYAGTTYRLTTGTFERVLELAVQLVPDTEPDVETGGGR